MSSTKHPQLFYTEYTHFAGRLLQDVNSSLEETHTQSPEVNLAQASLWTAAATVMGLHSLQAIIETFAPLAQFVHQHTELPSANPQSAKAFHLPLRIVSLLFRFTRKKEELEEFLREEYTAYFERIERTFNYLARECTDETISPAEHKHEVEALYLQSFYMFTRLSRMAER